MERIPPSAVNESVPQVPPTGNAAEPEPAETPPVAAAVQSEAARWLGREIAGRYRIVEQLGEGGMALVFRAERLGRIKGDVAIKILKPESAESRGMIARFLKEADAINKIQHPNVVHLIEFIELDDGVVFLVMDCLRGKTLHDLIRQMFARSEVFSWEQLAPLMQQTCEGLQAAHELGLVHRDIKPNNIFVCRPDSKAPFIKVLDFGIAKDRPKALSDASAETPLTQEGVFLGTLHYAAPENISAQTAEIDGRADIFSLGVVMYQCLTGTLPFQQFSHDKLSILYHTANTVPQPPRERAPERDIPPEVDALVMRAMALRPTDRFKTADELADAIKATLQPRSLPPERAGKGTGIKSGSIVELGQPAPQETSVKPAPGRVIIANPSRTKDKHEVGQNLETPIQGHPTAPATVASTKSPTVPQETNPRSSASLTAVLVVMVVGLLVLLALIVHELQPRRPAVPDAGRPPRAEMEPTKSTPALLSPSGKRASEVAVVEAVRPTVAEAPQREPEAPSPEPAGPGNNERSTIDSEEKPEDATSSPAEDPVTTPVPEEPTSEDAASAERRRLVRARLDEFTRTRQATNCLPLSTLFHDGVFDRLPIRVRVDSQGKATATITKVTVERRLSDKAGACIVAELGKMSFPKGPGIVVSHTLLFD